MHASLARLVALASLALALLAASACTSRTLPLPPPVIQSLSAPDPDGMVHISGLCHEGASVGVINEDTQVGVVVVSEEVNCDSSCPWEARIMADVDDTIRVWQFFETESSTYATVPGR